ncbi:MAG: FixH family protein [Pseudomonadota bacterium]
MIRELKGWHVLAMFLFGFSIIITVNLTLAFSAVRSFPGLEVKNSYVASQYFDAERSAQLALGWDINVASEGDVFVLSITDSTGPVAPVITRATLGRATHVNDDQELTFSFDGRSHRAPIKPLAPGNWNLRLVAHDGQGVTFKQRVVLRVRR